MKEVSFKNDKNQSLKGWLYKANDSNKLIIQCHGHPSSSHGTHVICAEFFERNDLNSFRFDFRGCGNSEGSFEECTVSTACNDLESAIVWAKNNGFEEVYLMGSSFGGAVVTLVAKDHPEIKKIVLRAPASDMSSIDEYDDFTTLEEWKNKGFFLYPNRDNSNNPFKVSFQFYLDAKNNILYELSKNVKAKTLILHGSKDDCVPLDQSQRLAKSIPHALLIVLDGADHTLSIDGSLEKGNNLMLDWFLD